MPERADFSARWIVKRAAKAAVAGALTAVGLHHAVRVLRRRQAGGARVLILSYHRVTPDFAATARESLASLLVSTATLRRQLEHVARHHEIVSLAEARRILAEPAGARRRDVVAVTLDDGYADVAEHALPVLAALRVPASVFVPTGYLGTDRRLPHDRLHATLTLLQQGGIPFERAGLPAPLQPLLTACAEAGPAATLDRLISRLPHDRLVALATGLEARLGRSEQDLPAHGRLMRWDEVRALDAAGLDVGGHTVNHAVLANLPLAEARRELQGCRDDLEAHLGKRPHHFAYPNGYYTPAVQEAVRQAGFEAAVTIEDEENRHGAGPLGLKRKVLWENTTLGPLGWSGFVATCNLGGVFSTLGLARPVPGIRPDPVPDALALAPEPAAPGAPEERAVS
ncbi:MAG: polysaccharide deacetylase family protein [Anaeromyxobacter sp.]